MKKEIRRNGKMVNVKLKPFLIPNFVTDSFGRKYRLEELNAEELKEQLRQFNDSVYKKWELKNKE